MKDFLSFLEFSTPKGYTEMSLNVAAINELGLTGIKKLLDGREISSVELVRAYRKRFQEDQARDLPINGYVEFFEDAVSLAEDADAHPGRSDRPLSGLPIAVKDNIHISGKALTCSSRVLEGYIAPYSATVIERLIAAGAIPLGRTNMDEFAMGSSCEYSCYGPSLNPVDRSRITGGSSGGSAAVVAAGQAPFALGSETGGSIRLPASYCGIYGFKPSYGTLSRYGLVAFGSSLDQIGFLSRSPDDIAMVLQACAGRDPRDNTSEETDFNDLFPLVAEDLAGLRFGVPEELAGSGIDESVREIFERFVEWLQSQGALVERFSMPILKACVALYYIIATAEASSNLSRFDGVRYGHRSEEWSDLLDMYERTRELGFGSEVKRRILVGNFVLSSGYYDAYYKKAQEVRALLKREVGKAFSTHRILLSPTSPVPPFKIGEKTDDPLAMYMTDICTTFANLTQTPAISIPAGTTAGGLPVGVQINGARFSEAGLLKIAQAWYDRGDQK